MKRKSILAAVTLLALTLMGSNVLAQPTYCTAGANLRFVGVGSEAQFNTYGWAAMTLELNAHGSYGLITSKFGTLTDSRAGTTNTAVTFFIVFDPTATTAPCDTYVYYQEDSGAADRDFFAYEKYTASASTVTGKQVFSSIGAAFGTVAFGVANAVEGAIDGCWIGAVNGPAACPGGAVLAAIPATIAVALNTSPATYVNQPVPPLPLAYCGNASTVVVTSQFYCYFNAAATVGRPEDALYATNRALAAYNGIVKGASDGGTLTGLGYGPNSPGCNLIPPNVGCPVLDSLGQGEEFFVNKWALSGMDPIKSGTLPSYTTLSDGVTPLMVLAGNEDAANLGNTFTDMDGNTNYTYNDVNHQLLQQVFSGYSACLSDLQSNDAGTGAQGQDIPLQMIVREPPSGVYNSFEFVAVRTQAGSQIMPGKPPVSNLDSGQDEFNDADAYPGHFSAPAGDCVYTAVGAGGWGYPQNNCFDPMFLSYQGGGGILVGSQCPGLAGGSAPGVPARLRAIGNGEEVSGVAGKYNLPGANGSANDTVFNPLGYSFWQYRGLAPLCAKVTGTTCSEFLGHYLAVDGIDPLFATAGGEYDHGYGNSGNPAPRNVAYNPSGAFNTPVCDFSVPCFVIPFTHIKDGTYPLWAILRTVTFAPVSGKVNTPPGVLDMFAWAQMVADCVPTTGCVYLGDYFPFFTDVSGSDGVYSGNLNLFAYRLHFEQTGGMVKPANGHVGCNGNFKGVTLQGGKSGTNTCLVDFGNDAGGSLVTVQSDVDFIADFGTEEYGLRQ
jgi:hypothetical protein